MKRRLLAVLGLIICGALVFTVPAGAQGEKSGTDKWQAVISGQLEAFRTGDSDTAFAYAGESFHNAFGTAEQFLQRIRMFGYAPLLQSRSHSFGQYTMEDGRVLQVVKFEGPDHKLYEALYILAPDPQEWRVQAVMMRRIEGVGV